MLKIWKNYYLDASSVYYALKKAHAFIDSNDEKTVAETIVKQFPSTTINSIETSLKSYKKINAWKKDLIATKDSFDRLQSVMSNAGELSEKADFNKIVNNSIAEKLLG